MAATLAGQMPSQRRYAGLLFVYVPIIGQTLGPASEQLGRRVVHAVSPNVAFHETAVEAKDFGVAHLSHCGEISGAAGLETLNPNH